MFKICVSYFVHQLNKRKQKMLVTTRQERMTEVRNQNIVNAAEENILTMCKKGRAELDAINNDRSLQDDERDEMWMAIIEKYEAIEVYL